MVRVRTLIKKIDALSLVDIAEEKKGRIFC